MAFNSGFKGLIIFKPAPCLPCDCLTACLPACHSVHSLLDGILHQSLFLEQAKR